MPTWNQINNAPFGLFVGLVCIGIGGVLGAINEWAHAHGWNGLGNGFLLLAIGTGGLAAAWGAAITSSNADLSLTTAVRRWFARRKSESTTGDPPSSLQ
jgi:hypothetical protein